MASRPTRLMGRELPSGKTPSFDTLLGGVGEQRLGVGSAVHGTPGLSALLSGLPPHLTRAPRRVLRKGVLTWRRCTAWRRGGGRGRGEGGFLGE